MGGGCRRSQTADFSWYRYVGFAIYRAGSLCSGQTRAASLDAVDPRDRDNDLVCSYRLAHQLFEHCAASYCDGSVQGGGVLIHLSAGKPLVGEARERCFVPRYTLGYLAHDAEWVDNFLPREILRAFAKTISSTSRYAFGDRVLRRLWRWGHFHVLA